MVLESTIVCVDTSEYMRNGDFLPTRIQAQQDAVNLVCLSKTRSNPENTVGLITLSDVKCLVTMTNDVGRILARLHQVSPNGKLSFIIGIRVAHLALKHRQGKNHRMRIVAFVGSPVESEEKELVKMAKKLKKEKVSVDLINFGEDSVNTDKLTAFINTINGNEGTGSHLVTIPPGTMLSDALMNSPIIVGEDGSGAVPGLPGASGGDFEFGFDPSTDPELAMALRISMEEQRQRQEDVTKEPGDGTTDKPIAQPADSEEALLEQALVMSNQPMSSFEETPTPDLGAMTEEEQIAYALQMSLRQTVVADLPSSAEPSSQRETPMETDTPATDSAASKPDDDFSEVMNDPEFLQSVLSTLPGVDPTSEDVQRAMGNLTQPKDSDKKEDKDSKK
ncbi:26S proteasome non-ATPase regulatory subunit 4 [Strongylocentrotus purpuratus]|uniref:26S proteasome non-ATPase regulatory subunit 4 n=1 Tax=Strongylocentrotus purpuratus TaxID=7668 RepID=A0A7M7NWZ7_STRPU|nr:26S proteasome non-ATPase regulatory subunit 4 [Strongylocentrotus purpuratus]|eukprot:XP_011661093.1 PREDICTED: 26S proteasome non-ATPase regulatory subunit 4 isoform X2 [Strongylocentrotus purpuratus]